MTAKDLKVNLLNALKDYLDFYAHPPEEVVILEGLANALDAKALVIKVELGDDKKNGPFCSIYNDANGMNEEEFENYHTVALSSKTKGQGIGFAGVGAKIYLAAWDNAKIFTETSTGHKSLASRMFRNDGKLQYEYVEPILKEKGTTYKIILNKSHYEDLKKNITTYVRYWFNQAIISGKKISVNGKLIKPWRAKIKKQFSGTIKLKNRKFPYKFFITSEDIPDDRCNIEFIVFGKRIMVKQPTFLHELKSEYRKKFYMVVNLEQVSEQLLANKEGFKAGFVTGHVFPTVESELYQLLKKADLLDLKADDYGQKLIQNVLTERLDKLFAKKEWKWLNPWFASRERTVLTPDKDGEKHVIETEGGQSTGKGRGNGIGVSGPDGKGYTEADDGIPASEKKKTTRGLFISPVDRPNDTREGFIEPESKFMVYNIGHSFHKKIENSITARNYNLARVVITELIKYGASKKEEEMSYEEALKTLTDALHEVWE